MEYSWVYANINFNMVSSTLMLKLMNGLRVLYTLSINGTGSTEKEFSIPFYFAKVAGGWVVIAVFRILLVIGFLGGEHQWQIIIMSRQKQG